MYNNFSSLTVTDCMFDGNLAEVAGGMYNHESAPVIKSTVFHENRASMLGGGGLYCVESDAMVINCCTRILKKKSVLLVGEVI